MCSFPRPLGLFSRLRWEDKALGQNAVPTARNQTREQQRVMVRAEGLKPECVPDSFRGLVKTWMARPSSQSPGGLGKDPRISIPNKFPGEAATTGLEAQPENHWAWDVGRAPTQLVQTGYLGRNLLPRVGQSL